MVKRKQGTTLMIMAVLMLSLVFSGIANAAGIATIKKDGMELYNLRQAAEMYGYSIQWNAKERSVTLAYKGKMDDMMMKDDDTMMKNDTMMEDGMMKDETMMESGMKPAGEMIKLWIGSKKIVVDGMEVSLSTAPMISRSSTYVSEAFISQYLMPVKAMK